MEIKATGVPVPQEYHPKTMGRTIPDAESTESNESVRHAISSEKTMLEPEQVKQLFFVFIGHGVHAVSGGVNLGSHVNAVV